MWPIHPTKAMKNSFQFSLVLLLLFPVFLRAQPDTVSAFHPQFSVLFGLNQPLLLGGFNAELNYWGKRIVIDYSHGVELKMPGTFVGGEVEQQQLDVKIPHTLGLGFGYRFTPGFNLRIEPKWHIFELYHSGDPLKAANRIGRYSTFTLGLGAYYRWLPFSRKQNALKGITIAPSVRWWPRLASTLQDDVLIYTGKDGQSKTHQALNIGVQNTPWIINISVGYSFGTTKR